MCVFFFLISWWLMKLKQWGQVSFTIFCHHYHRQTWFFVYKEKLFYMKKTGFAQFKSFLIQFLGYPHKIKRPSKMLNHLLRLLDICLFKTTNILFFFWNDIFWNNFWQNTVIWFAEMLKSLACTVKWSPWNKNSNELCTTAQHFCNVQTVCTKKIMRKTVW